MQQPQDPALVAIGLREPAIQAPDTRCRGVASLQQTGGRAVGDLPITNAVQLQFPSEIILAPSEIGLFHVAEIRTEGRPRQTVHDVPGVPFARRAGLEALRMTQRPLELPLFAVLRLNEGLRRREQQRRVVHVIVAEELPAPHVLHVEPARREPDDRDREFPAVLAAVGSEWLDVDPGAGLWIDAVDIDDFVIQDVGDVVGHLAAYC